MVREGNLCPFLLLILTFKPIIML